MDLEEVLSDDEDEMKAETAAVSRMLTYADVC